MNLPYFEPEDTSTKNLTDQLFKQQTIITDLLNALMGARGVLYSASCYLGTSFRDDAKYWHEIADEEIRKAEGKNA